MRSRKRLLLAALAMGVAWVPGMSAAAVYTVTVDGPDAIFLAGRTDVWIPAANLPWTTGTHLIRHGGPTPEEAQEQIPPSIPWIIVPIAPSRIRMRRAISSTAQAGFSGGGWQGRSHRE